MNATPEISVDRVNTWSGKPRYLWTVEGVDRLGGHLALHGVNRFKIGAEVDARLARWWATR